MPFDITPDQGGGGFGGADPLILALQALIASLYGHGLRPGHFGPGQRESVRLRIDIRVHDNDLGFALESATLEQWDQIEQDPDPDNEDDVVG